MEDILRVAEEEIKKLSEKNGQLKKDLAFKETMLDNVKAEYENLQDINKKLKAELERIKQRVKEHTTYSVKAEFIKKFWE